MGYAFVSKAKKRKMGNVNTFLTEEDYRQINEETGCKYACHCSESLLSNNFLLSQCIDIREGGGIGNAHMYIWGCNGGC